ncbi:hypothetical protein [Daejeonella lutea]|uniref:Uncharacterized protein n=1 Tax=Daejeonella lutea TaxID=572036 RepID=A0A1T5F2C9_9SPHI|nr:hypothetical protein [Daejeonella lutea]SKB90200.1 hypothetical protein SAMN05661099_3391 [Daejeonella lutea]
MHRISDKELDKLFQQRFADAEFQPSAEVWGKIASKMDQKQKVKRTFPVFWMAAASVVAVIGAGLWFYRPVEVIRLQGTQQEMVENTPEDVVTDIATGERVMDHVHPEIKGFDFSKLAASEDKSYETPVAVTIQERSSESSPKQEVIAANSSRRNVPEAVQSRKEVKVPRYDGDQSQLDVTKPDMIASADVVKEDLSAEPEQVAPKRIRSVGSLVNFVISKVDRREDKIIEFKDGDEGSEVSGINLGLIKLKSRNR